MVNNIRLLGVKIADKLQWGYQVEQIKDKVLQALVLIKHARKLLPVRQTVTLTCRKFIADLLNRISAIVVRFGTVLENPN